MRVSIPEQDLPEPTDGDLAPWEILVPEGWHRVRVREAADNKWGDGDEILSIRYEVLDDGAVVDAKLDTTRPADLAKLAKLARAVGLDPADLDTDHIQGHELDVKVKHGGEKRNAPYVWLNVVAWRPAHKGPEEAGELPDDLEF